MSRTAKFTGNMERDIRSLFEAMPVFVEITTPATAGQELEIQHGLGRVPNGFSVVKGDAIGFNGGSVPCGAILLWTDAGTLDETLACNGQAISRTTYSDLFDVIGTAFGTGDGSTTFNIPDLRGRVPIGNGTGTGLTQRNIGDSIGAETHQLTISEMPAHTHNLPFAQDGATDTAEYVYNAAGGNQTTSSTGGDGSHNNMQPSLCTAFHIKWTVPGGAIDLTPDTDWTDQFLYAKFSVSSRDLTLAIF